MEKMSFADFKDYCKQNYLEYNKMHNTETNSVVEFILSNYDRWFYIENSILYLFHVLGIELVLLDGKYIIYQNSNTDIPELVKGDEILSVDGVNPIEVLHETYINKRMLLLTLKSNLKEYKNVYLIIPDIKTNNSIGINLHENNEESGIIKITSFSSVDYDRLSTFLKRKKRITIDLTEASGGILNSMITFARFLSNGELSITVENSSGRILTNVITTDSKINISNIDWIIGSNTASSAEIFCLLLRKNYCGKVYGQKSTGKLVIQKPIDVDGHIIKVPIYRFVKPHILYGNQIAKYEGDRILPDVVIT